MENKNKTETFLKSLTFILSWTYAGMYWFVSETSECVAVWNTEWLASNRNLIKKSGSILTIWQTIKLYSHINAKVLFLSMPFLYFSLFDDDDDDGDDVCRGQLWLGAVGVCGCFYRQTPSVGFGFFDWKHPSHHS